MGQALVTAKFYMHGRSHFTATGWEKASKLYKVGDLDGSLVGKVFMVTGANSGIGFKISEYLASKGGKVYMVCRNKERGEAAIEKMVSNDNSVSKENLGLLVADVSLKNDVEQLVLDFNEREKALDCLVCNAGALLSERTLTREGVETTFAAHLLYGSYYLAKQLFPVLESSEDPRVVFVSSGGMYNVKFPSDEVATSKSEKKKYDGQLAYAYAKRGQVMLAEEWARSPPDQSKKIKFVSCHPGWAATPGVDAAYGSKSKYLEPMRTLWQGAEGICWLCVKDSASFPNGEFFLDRTPQPKHLASATKNNPEDTPRLLKLLADMC
eukprot:m.8492 g.8492  ORF g.8492 m.8492 type:complete len:324 (+) comp3908_c0_seq1:293-1264(+)